MNAESVEELLREVELLEEQVKVAENREKLVTFGFHLREQEFKKSLEALECTFEK